MSDVDGKPEITPEILMDLHRQGNIATTEAASARGEYGTLLKSKQETHNLNVKAFKMASQIRKMENGKREHFFRDLMKYCDLMQVEQQKDLLDTMADNSAGKVRTDLDKAMDGEPREAPANAKGQPVKTSEPEGNVSKLNAAYGPNTSMGKHTLNAYSASIRDMTDREAITAGLERFCQDHPKLADEASVIAKDRLSKIGEEQGGGEDLRSTAQRESEQQEVEQAGQTGKRTARARKAKGEGEAPALH